MTDTLKVGVIGASATRGWARVSHAPAVKGVDGLDLYAVAGSDQVSAQAAAEDFGAKVAFGKAEDLIASPDVDIVAVSVKVPDHRDLVLSACKAGKHVYCEWPLGRNAQESAEMASAARSSNVKTAIGLQLRGSPTLKHAANLIREGAIGRVLAVHVETSTVAFGPEVEPAMRFAEDPANGVTLLTIQGAHTLDGTLAVLGQDASLRLFPTTQYPTVSFDGVHQQRQIPDHVSVHGKADSGASISIEVSGGRHAGALSEFRFTGEGGEVKLVGIAPRGVQSSDLKVFLNGELSQPREDALFELPKEAINVAGIYQRLRDDILYGGRTAPDFEHSLRLSTLLEAMWANHVTSPSAISVKLGSVSPK